MRRILMFTALFAAYALSAYAGVGKITIECNVKGASIYINGNKIAITAKRYTNLLLDEGEYEIELKKRIDGKWRYLWKKTVYVREDTSKLFNIKRNKMSIRKRFSRIKKMKSNFSRVSKSVVKYKKSGLMWQDDSAARTVKKSYKEAESYCKNLSLDDQSDWRLPTYNELLTLVDFSRYDPAINPVFENAFSGYYWTSSDYAGDAGRVWSIYFRNGLTRSLEHSNESYVRCVRGRE